MESRSRKVVAARTFLQNLIEENNHDSNIDIEDALIEFAQIHVEAALKEVSEKAKITYVYSGNTGSEYCDEYVDKESILNSYPSSNIE